MKTALVFIKKHKMHDARPFDKHDFKDEQLVVGECHHLGTQISGKQLYTSHVCDLIYSIEISVNERSCVEHFLYGFVFLYVKRIVLQ